MLCNKENEILYEKNKEEKREKNYDMKKNSQCL
jgi:hypothetical protein